MYEFTVIQAFAGYGSTEPGIGTPAAAPHDRQKSHRRQNRPSHCSADTYLQKGWIGLELNEPRLQRVIVTYQRKPHNWMEGLRG